MANFGVHCESNKNISEMIYLPTWVTVTKRVRFQKQTRVALTQLRRSHRRIRERLTKKKISVKQKSLSKCSG